MERPTSDKILFINSDILIHLMPSKCGILNPGISHNISLVPPQHRGLCRAHTSSPYPETYSKYFPNSHIWTTCVVAARFVWPPICVALWLLALCVWWQPCGRAPACVVGEQTIGCGVVHNQKTEPYPLAASEEIDRSVGPMISRRSSKLDR